MIKGDKVVCIHTSYIERSHKFTPVTQKLILGEIYTVDNPNGGNNDMSLKEISDTYFDKLRFISLIDFRRQKIMHLKNELQKNR